MSKNARIRAALIAAAILTAPLWLQPLALWLAFSPFRLVGFIGSVLLGFELLFGLAAFFCLLVVVAGPILALFRRHRVHSIVAVVAAVLFVGSFVGGIHLGRAIWLENIKMIAKRGAPLIAAIDEYAAKHGRPPRSLAELLPQHLDSIPTTGVAESPEFQYVVDKQDVYDGNSWVLIVTPPCPPMGFDQLLYFPLRNYPPSGHGGSIEQIDGWGYVHE
jgi:hypothetical protein